MRTAGNLYSRLVSLEHLERAAKATVRGKRRRRDVAWFLFTIEQQLEELQADLASGRYRPEGFELVTIRDPKPRVIARVPIKDRVLHTAVVQLIEPIFAPSFSPDDYACRRGYGAHRAVLRLLKLMRRYRYALHLDIKNYFPSIDAEIVRALLAYRIRDARFLDVVEVLLEAGRGLYDDADVRRRAGLSGRWPPPGRGIPIGSYTSQLFAAHIYLSDFDHYVKRRLKVAGYLRYVDDLFCFGDRRGELEGWRRGIADWLAAERRLRLKHEGVRILPCRRHLDALGYRIERAGIRSRPRALRRPARRALQEVGRCSAVGLEGSLASSTGVILF